MTFSEGKYILLKNIFRKKTQLQLQKKNTIEKKLINRGACKVK